MKLRFNLHKYLKKNRKILNELSIFINIFFLTILFSEFFLPNNDTLRIIQIFLGFFFIIELFMRIKLHKYKWKYILNPYNFLDIIIIISIFIRFGYTDNALLHFFTALKILRSYRIILDLSQVSYFFERNRDLILSVLNLLIFSFFMASLVYVAQVDQNNNINSFLDALYFTLSTLTTTGFGDITLIGENGKILSILIMTFGTGLFLRLISILFRPIKKHVQCQYCGLKRHDKDASHCKHCGNIIYIENDGESGN